MPRVGTVSLGFRTRHGAATGELVNSIMMGGSLGIIYDGIGMRLMYRTITVKWRLGCGCRGESRWYR
jgi:hypothetical protein